MAAEAGCRVASADVANSPLCNHKEAAIRMAPETDKALWRGHCSSDRRCQELSRERVGHEHELEDVLRIILLKFPFSLLGAKEATKPYSTQAYLQQKNKIPSRQHRESVLSKLTQSQQLPCAHTPARQGSAFRRYPQRPQRLSWASRSVFHDILAHYLGDRGQRGVWRPELRLL